MILSYEKISKTVCLRSDTTHRQCACLLQCGFQLQSKMQDKEKTNGLNTQLLITNKYHRFCRILFLRFCDLCATSDLYIEHFSSIWVLVRTIKFQTKQSKIQSKKLTHIELEIETTKPRRTDFNTTIITINTSEEQRPLIANVTSNNQPDANPPPFNRLYPELNARLHYEAIPN